MDGMAWVWALTWVGLDLENKKTYTLYELDNNEEIQNKIMELIPEIRKYYSFNGIKAVGEPSKIKRPWLSIIKHLTKEKYNLESKYHCQIFLNQYLFRVHLVKVFLPLQHW